MAPPEPSQENTTAGVVVDYLHAAGVRTVFGYPGDPTIELMEAARLLGIDSVLARREGTAAIMAQAHAMVDAAPGVCLSTLGPGSTALLPGVASAYLDRVPMVAISGQISTRRESTFTHQWVDHHRLYSPVTKWTARLTPDTAGRVMRKALRIAHAERPGSVHLSLSSDLAAAPASDHEVRLPPMRPYAASTVVVSGDGRDPFSLLRGSRRPVAVVGPAAVRAGAGDALERFAAQFGMPVVVSPMAKGIYPEDAPWFAGVIDMAANQVVWDLLAEADLVLAVGFDPVELIKDWSSPAPVIHVDAVPNLDQVYPAEVEMIGHIPALLDALAAEGSPGERWSEAEVKAHRDRLRTVYYSGRRNGALNPTDVVDLIRAVVPDDTVITTDVGSHKLLVGQGWTSPLPRRFLVTNGLSAMGFALPAAISAKLALPATPVVCTIGDGGLAMVQGELGLASERGTGMLVAVFCDNSLNRIELKQRFKGYPPTATTMEPVDVAGVAEAMGCDAAVATSVPELERILGDVGDLATRTLPLVIEARIDPSQYEAQF